MIIKQYVVCDKAIYSVKQNTYIVINTELTKCFVSNEQSSGQYLIHGHGEFSECALNTPCPYIKDWPEGGSLEPKHVANYVLMTIYVLCLTE